MSTEATEPAQALPAVVGQVERGVGRPAPERYFDDRDECFEEPCTYCRGDGRDPYTDYLMPCLYCDGGW
jgi:hypothetical protein